jgi:hypothetical protein
MNPNIRAQMEIQKNNIIRRKEARDVTHRVGKDTDPTKAAGFLYF